jgi:hypothetical protein
MNELRSNKDMRALIEKMLCHGWSLSGRDPVRLELRGRVKLVRGGALIDG